MAYKERPLSWQEQLSRLPQDRLTPTQQDVAARIVAGGPREVGFFYQKDLANALNNSPDEQVRAFAKLHSDKIYPTR